MRLSRGLTSLIATSLAASVIAVSTAPVTAQSQPSCVSDSTQTGVAVTDTLVLALPGRAWGETIVVTQSVVQAVTVWMIPLPAGIYSESLYLHVTDVDSLGMPLVTKVLRNGPEIDLETSDGVNPPRCTFTLDPPLALTKGKRYFFVVREATCFAGLPLVAYRNNPYPPGSAWNVGQSYFCDGLGGLKGQTNPGWDLRMTLTYCNSDVVAARRSSWGRLKASYR